MSISGYIVGLKLKSIRLIFFSESLRNDSHPSSQHHRFGILIENVTHKTPYSKNPINSSTSKLSITLYTLFRTRSSSPRLPLRIRSFDLLWPQVTPNDLVWYIYIYIFVIYALYFEALEWIFKNTKILSYL